MLAFPPRIPVVTPVLLGPGSDIRMMMGWKVQRGVCVLGGTKSLSTSTRTGVRRSAVFGSAHTQQTPLKLHVEKWEGLVRNRARRFSGKWKSYRGVLSVWLVLHVLIILLSHLGQAEKIRNMLGWSLLEKTERSGVWVFRGALQGKNLFSSLDVVGDWERKGSYHTAWAVPCDVADARACG